MVVVDVIAVVIVSMNELNLGTIQRGYWAPRNESAKPSLDLVENSCSALRSLQGVVQHPDEMLEKLMALEGWVLPEPLVVVQPLQRNLQVHPEQPRTHGASSWGTCKYRDGSHRSP